MSHEVWKEVPGYSMYEVSTYGRVRSWHNNKHGRRKKPRMRKMTLNTKGYPIVDLWKNGRWKMFKIHALVLATFIGPRPLGLECCHNDGAPTKNHLENLRYDTPASNQADRLIHGTSNRGEAHGQSKLTEEQVVEIRALYAQGRLTQAKLGARFGVHRTTIGGIIRREYWAHLP